jgi:hypothetical protein
MPTGVVGTAARDVKAPVKQVISFTLNFNTTGAASGIRIGTIPANAVIQNWRVNVQTLFNAGTTNPITIGTTATGAEIAASASITSGTAGVYTGSPAAANGWRAQPADQGVFTSYIPTGTAATTGLAYIVVEYIVLDNG